VTLLLVHYSLVPADIVFLDSDSRNTVATLAAAHAATRCVAAAILPAYTINSTPVEMRLLQYMAP
jgi:hypothetical protein